MRYGKTGAGVAGRFWERPDSTRKVRADPREENRAEMAQICLSCTKSRCSGTSVCFRKMKETGASEE